MKCVIHPYHRCLSKSGICHYDERAIGRLVFGPFGTPVVSIIFATFATAVWGSHNNLESEKRCTLMMVLLSETITKPTPNIVLECDSEKQE
jgi:hypothetical protein